jgi:hypothetical protein
MADTIRGNVRNYSANTGILVDGNILQGYSFPNIDKIRHSDILNPQKGFSIPGTMITGYIRPTLQFLGNINTEIVSFSFWMCRTGFMNSYIQGTIWSTDEFGRPDMELYSTDWYYVNSVVSQQTWSTAVFSPVNFVFNSPVQVNGNIAIGMRETGDNMGSTLAYQFYNEEYEGKLFNFYQWLEGNILGFAFYRNSLRFEVTLNVTPLVYGELIGVPRRRIFIIS